MPALSGVETREDLVTGKGEQTNVKTTKGLFSTTSVEPQFPPNLR